MDERIRRERLLIKPGKIRVVIDSDAKNEVDDQYAIAWALKSPERLSVEAIYAAPFSHSCMQKIRDDAGLGGTVRSVTPEEGMRLSYEEIKKICSLSCFDVPVYRGAEQYINGNWPVVSEAVTDLINRARNNEGILYVAACGVLTNIASALMLAPDIVDSIVVVWLGGQPSVFGHMIEFNAMQDVKATQVVLDSGVPLVMIPCMNAASMLGASESELRENLCRKNPLCDYLYDIVSDEFSDMEAEKDFMLLDRFGYLRGREDSPEEYLSQFGTSNISWSRILWDTAVTAFLINPCWLPSRLVPAPVLNDDLTTSHDDSRHSIREVTFVWRNFIFGEMFHALKS